MKMINLTNRIYQVGGSMGSGVWGANVFLLIDTPLTLVDTGFRGNTGRIVAALRRLGRSPSDIDRIIITHHHADHIGSLAPLKKLTGATVMAHAADAPSIDGREPPPGPSRPRWAGPLMSPLLRIMAPAPVPVDEFLGEGDELPVLGGIRILHMPGHTPGSICIYIPGERTLLAGDVLNNRRGLGMPSRIFTVDGEQAMDSIRRIASLDFDRIGFGHGAPILHDANKVLEAFAKGLESKRRQASQKSRYPT